ncbi:MAG TPA: hypothetical protein VI488_08000 [Candidatus Angelobacter sp.]
MSLHSLLGVATEKAINAWVRMLGRSIDPADHPWLKCPVGSPKAVGTEMYNDIAAAEGLEQRSSASAGLLASFDDLRSDRFDSAKVDPQIRNFYERTAAYDLDAWSQVGTLARPFLWGLVTLVSRRMDQLVFPLSPLELSAGMGNEIIELVDKSTGQRVYTGWRRTLLASNAIIYAGLYSATVPPNYGRPCVRVTFPVRLGSAVVILRPEAQADGPFKLIAEGRTFGDPGFYRIVSTGPSRWSVRYLPGLHENFHVYKAPDGTLRTEHNIRLAGVPTLTLHYKMPLVRGVAASL